jgi:hypothetical protein
VSDLPLKDGATSDTLDQDIQALKEWLAQAWRYLAQPSLTRFQRQEMLNQMKLADAKLRAGLQKIASRDKLILTDNRYADHAGAQQNDPPKSKVDSAIGVGLVVTAARFQL